MVAARGLVGVLYVTLRSGFVALAPIVIHCSRSTSLAKLLKFWILLSPWHYSVPKSPIKVLSSMIVIVDFLMCTVHLIALAFL